MSRFDLCLMRMARLCNMLWLLQVLRKCPHMYQGRLIPDLQCTILAIPKIWAFKKLLILFGFLFFPFFSAFSHLKKTAIEQKCFYFLLRLYSTSAEGP